MVYTSNMRYLTLILTLAASLPKALSFAETSPVIAWSSHRCGALDRLRPGFISTGSTPPFLNDISTKLLLSDTDVCEFDAVIIVDHPGLHASDLRSLSPSSSLATRLQDSPSSIQLPYVRFPPSSSLANYSPLQDLADKLAGLCGAQHLALPLDNVAVDLTPSSETSKRVLSLSMPALTENAGARKRSVTEHETRLANELERIGRAYPRHLVILAGSRRQDGPAPVPSGSPSPPEGGILARYQLLTPALITGLLLVFFVLVPIVLFGVSALASIQSPLRVQPPKGYSADEKKNQ
ncbi:hypothetical protein F5888DRAFT_1201376 [Russula emetica]|nr:hypothetical protein F5888DRAFT_1201376 [Russula emetica]